MKSEPESERVEWWFRLAVFLILFPLVWGAFLGIRSLWYAIIDARIEAWHEEHHDRP